MSDYRPDEFGDNPDFTPPEVDPEFQYAGRFSAGEGSVLFDVYLDYSRESFISNADLDSLRDFVSLPDFAFDIMVDQHQVDPDSLQPGEAWQTGPFESPQDAWEWAMQMGVAGFSEWYEDENGDFWIVIDKDSGSNA